MSKKTSKWTDPIVIVTICSVVVLATVSLFIFYYPILTSESDKLEATLVLWQSKILTEDRDTVRLTISIKNGGTQQAILTYMQPMFFFGENFPYNTYPPRPLIDLPTYPITIKPTDIAIMRLQFSSRNDDIYAFGFPDSTTTEPSMNRYAYLGINWTSMDSKGKEYINYARLFRITLSAHGHVWYSKDTTQANGATPLTNGPINLYTTVRLR